MVAVGLYAELCNLAEAVLAGDVSKLSEFQQAVQYAPDGLKEQIRVKYNL